MLRGHRRRACLRSLRRLSWWCDDLRGMRSVPTLPGRRCQASVVGQAGCLARSQPVDPSDAHHEQRADMLDPHQRFSIAAAAAIASTALFLLVVPEPPEPAEPRLSNGREPGRARQQEEHCEGDRHLDGQGPCESAQRQGPRPHQSSMRTKDEAALQQLLWSQASIYHMHCVAPCNHDQRPLFRHNAAESCTSSGNIMWQGNGRGAPFPASEP